MQSATIREKMPANQRQLMHHDSRPRVQGGLTYFPFVSVAACWKIGCILLQTPHPATTSGQQKLLQRIQWETPLWQHRCNCQKVFHHLPGELFFVVVVVGSSFQGAIGCGGHDILKTTDHNNWTHLLLSNNRQSSVHYLNMTVLQLVLKQSSPSNAVTSVIT